METLELKKPVAKILKAQCWNQQQMTWRGQRKNQLTKTQDSRNYPT